MPRPKPKPTPQPTPTASPSPTIARTTAGEAQVASDAAATPPPLDPETEKALNEQATESKIKRPKMVNKKPFLDLLAKANQMKESGELDLSGSITMTVEADRNPDGTLYNVFIDDAKGDKKLKALATEFVAALSASTALSFLEDTRHLRLKLNLNQQSLTGEVDTQVDSEQRAAELKKGYSGMIALARFARRGKDDGALLNNTTVSSSGKQVTVRFTMEREAATKLLVKQLPSG